MSDTLRIVYLVEIFDSQVLNGGFDQYFTSGYGQFASLTIPAVNKIGGLKKANLLATAFKFVNAGNYPDKIFAQKLLDHETEELYVNDEIFEQLHILWMCRCD